jgi:hypothetical protein
MKKYDNLDMYIFSCGDLDSWQCPLLTEEQQIAVAKEFVKLYEQIEDKYPSVLYHLLTDPAAKTHHQNYEGGLTEHNFKFACYLYSRALAIYPNTNLIESVVKIAVCHDLCKVNLYKLGSDGKYSYNYKEYEHHAKESVRRAKILGIELSQLERVCVLLHMDGGFWDHEVEAELSDSDRELLCNNIRFISAVQWADMKACE